MNPQQIIPYLLPVEWRYQVTSISFCPNVLFNFTIAQTLREEIVYSNPGEKQNTKYKGVYYGS